MLSTMDIFAFVLAATMMLAPLAAVSIIAPPTPDAPLAETMPSQKRTPPVESAPAQTPAVQTPAPAVKN